MKITNKVALELFVICKKEDYSYIRDTLFPSLTKECGMGFVVNGYVSIEKKESIKPPSSTGAFFIYTDVQKMPLSINKMVSDSVLKLNIPAIFSTSKDPVEIKTQIYDSIPQFSVYCETSKLLKQSYSSPRSFTFIDFQNLLMEEKESTLSFFPCTEIYTEKTHGENLFKFIQTKVDALGSRELILTPHSLLNYFRDVPSLIADEPDNEFVIQFLKNWIFGLVKHYEGKEFSFYSDTFEHHFEKSLSDLHKNYLISLLPNDPTFTLDIQGLTLTYTKGVSLNIKEIYSTHIITDGSISIDSTSNNKIFNLTIDCNA
jgi:hypothetical protein